MTNEKIIWVIVWTAFSTVGWIQWAKNIFKFEKPEIWALIMVPVGLLFAFIFIVCPTWVMIGISAIACIQLLWENVFQTIKNLFPGKKDE